jgi:hypothetical protein
MVSAISTNRKHWTPEETEYLINNYSGPESAPMIALRLGIPLAAVGRKARALGYSRTENRRAGWTEEELSLLEAWAETKPLPKLTASWNRKAAKNGWPKRSPNAIGKIVRKLGYTTKPIVGCYSARAVAAALGVSGWAVQTWIKCDGLKAQKQGLGEHSNWVIRDKDLVQFALSQPAKITARITPDGADWLLQVIADSRK